VTVDGDHRTHPESAIVSKLQTVHELFGECGLQPRSFRGGRYSSGGPIHTVLKALGFTVDSSIVPFSSFPETGAPDFRSCDPEPRCAGENVHRHGFWEVPLTLGFTRPNFRHWAARFAWFETPWLRSLRIGGMLANLGIVRRVWLNFETDSSDAMLQLLPVVRELGLPAVIFTVHSSSLVLNGNP